LRRAGEPLQCLPRLTGGCPREGPRGSATEDNSRMRPMQASKGLAMEKRLCWAALGVAGLWLVIFLLDLVLNMPFGLRSVSPAVDIVIMLCCALLGYLAWDALRDQL